MLAALRLCFELAVLGGIAFLAFAQPYEARVAAAAVALWGGLAGGVLLCARPVARLLSRRGIAALELLVFTLCAAALLTEIGLRAASRLRPSPLLVQDSDEVVYYIEHFRLEPGALQFGFPANSRGFYDEEFVTPSRKGRSVAMVGDSFSVGVVPHHFHFSSVAERALRDVEIYNIGISAVGPAEYRHLLEAEALPLGPDLVVVNLFLGNDLTDAARGRRDRSTLRSWLDREHVLLYQVPRRLRKLRQEELLPIQFPPPGFEILGASGWRRLESVEEMERSYPWLADHRLEEAVFSRKLYLEQELKRATAASEASDADYDLLRAQVAAMREVAGDVPFAVVLIPDEFQVEDPLWEAIRARHAGPDLERDRAQRELRAWLESQGIPHLDLLPLLRAVPPTEDGWRHLYHRLEGHLNARGNRVVGAAIAGFLAEHLGLLPGLGAEG